MENQQLFEENNYEKENSLITLALPTLEGFTIIKVGEIIRCEASGNYTYFYLENNLKILISKTLKDFERLLGTKEFCRIHNSHLININHLRKYIKGKGGHVVMSDGSMVDVAVRKKEAFMRRVIGKLSSN
ncbi:MAG: LytTR family transcriptional regulator [Bacteroidetes bacterium]|nr:LytTR family transcriptional regulator [Bacteroidota bacterium]